MKLTLGSNIASLTTQRQLGRSNERLGTIFERLASGQRINRASEDPAGLAIAESLRADASIFQQGVRNLNDGISLLSVADAAISELQNITSRMKELAHQSANGSYTNEQRSVLDLEAQALREEYNRIARSTEFNDQNLFDSGFLELSLQAAFSSISSSLGGTLGDGTFQNTSFFTSTGLANNPISINSVDVNNDGILDLVGGDYAGQIAVLLGNGDGTFRDGGTYATGAGTRELAIDDINNDGFVDVVTTNIIDTSVSVLLGDGTGGFTHTATLASENQNFGLDLGDLNGDGVADIVVTGSAQDDMYIYLGNGDGTFGSVTTYNIPLNPLEIELVDLNNDGILDALSTTSNGSNQYGVMIGNGDGTFQAALTYTTSYAHTSVDLPVGDFDGDGNIDFLVQNSAQGTFSILLGNGDGTFQAEIESAQNTSGADIVKMQTADLNGDGILDVATGTVDELNIYIGNGDGTFQAPSISYAVLNNLSHLEFGDFNNDGVQDLVGTSQIVNIGYSILLGNSTTGIANLEGFDLSTRYGALQSMRIFDTTESILSDQRGTIGAFMTRLEFAMSHLRASAENYEIAEAQIRDADIATEAAKLLKETILQQAQAAVLGQANVQPEIALLLLR